MYIITALMWYDILLAFLSLNLDHIFNDVNAIPQTLSDMILVTSYQLGDYATPLLFTLKFCVFRIAILTLLWENAIICNNYFKNYFVNSRSNKSIIYFRMRQKVINLIVLLISPCRLISKGISKKKNTTQI